MNKRISVGLAAAIAMIAITITFATTLIFSMRLFDAKVAGYRERAEMYSKISETDSIIRENYYGSISDIDVDVNTIRGYLSGLNDKNTLYLTAAEYAENMNRRSGREPSYGISVSQNVHGYMEISAVVPESEAEALGIMVGDIVTTMNSSAVTTTNYVESESLLKAQEGESLSLILNRAGKNIPVSLVCEVMDVSSCIHYMVNDDVGYLRIFNFTDTLPEQFKRNLDSLLSAGVSGLIVDVRGCYLGSYTIENLVEVLNMVIPSSGSMISGKYADGSVKLLATSDSLGSDIPIVLLVNGKTEYFGELFAAVLRDRINAPIVGDTTAGHGTYQSVYTLSDGSALIVSTALLLTPDSGSFNETGIMPDYVVQSDYVQASLYSRPSEIDDPQYARALVVLDSITE